jgi:hypothetical protein
MTFAIPYCACFRKQQKVRINALMDVNPMDSNFKLLVFWRIQWIDERLFFLPEELADAAIPVSFLQVDKDKVWFPDFTSLEGECTIDVLLSMPAD